MIVPNQSLRKILEERIEAMHLGYSNIFGLAALNAAYKNGDAWLNELLPYLQKNINYVCNFFKTNTPKIMPIMPQGTYLLWIDCSALFNKHSDIRSFFIQKANLGLSDGLLFGKSGHGFQRMNIAAPLSTIKKACEQIQTAYSLL